MKKMLKVLCVVLIVVIVTGLFSMVTFAGTAPNIVAEYDFATGKEGWSLYAGDNGETLSLATGVDGGEDKCLAIQNHNKSWESPMKDIGDIIQLSGAGTYTVYAKVKTTSTASNLKCRIVLRFNNSFSFESDETSGIAGIGVPTKVKGNTWTQLSASFKVTQMDVEKGGNIDLCFDYLNDNATFYVDDVIICKLSEYGITNGDFSYGVIGWRNWYDSQNFSISTLRKGSGSLVNCAHYITASTYGSIACNVDQIIANYDYITYQIDFDMYLPSDAHNILEDIKFYLTGGADTYHIYLGSKTQSQMVSNGWTHVSITFDSSENDGDIPYMAILEPHYEEVFFRIQFDSKYSAGTTADEEYYLTNFEFKPKKSSSYISSSAVVISNQSLQLKTGESYQLSAYVLPANSTYKGIQWVSDGNAVIISSDGLVTAVGRHGSTGTITAYSEDGTSLARCYVTINN